MKAVITGCAGFIGSHVTDLFLARGWEVLGIDDLSTGRESNMPCGHERFKFKLWDLSDAREILLVIPEEFKGAPIIHIAGLADLVPAIENPVVYYRANVLSSVHMAELARIYRAPILYAGSSSIYGDGPQNPVSINAPGKPRHPYALSKWHGDRAIWHWHEVYGTPTIILRMFNVYGRRARTSGRYGAMMGTFLGQKLHGLPLTIVGDGEQSRDFIHVRDVAGLFFRAISRARDGQSGVYNVGSGHPVRVNAVADCIDPAGKRACLPERKGEPRSIWANVEETRRTFRWAPGIGIQEGILGLLEHIEEFRDAPAWTAEMIEEETAAWHQTVGR